MDTNLLERGNPITLRELIENSSEESTIILSVHQGYTGLQWDTYVLESHQKERLLGGSGYEIQIDTGDEIITAVIPSAEMLGQQVSNVSVQEDGKIQASIKWWESLEEKAFIAGKDTFSIYQLKRGVETRDFLFEPYERLQAAGLDVDPANYDLIYTAPLEPNMSLDNIFTRFNIDRPADFKGHSLSVSDVIVLHQGGQDTAHYVDSIGFQEVPEFFREITPDARMTGEQIRTPRGSFHVTDMTREQMEAAGYGFHHQSEDGKYLIMGNGTDAFAISAVPKEEKLKESGEKDQMQFSSEDVKKMFLKSESAPAQDSSCIGAR